MRDDATRETRQHRFIAKHMRDMVGRQPQLSLVARVTEAKRRDDNERVRQINRLYPLRRDNPQHHERDD